MFGVKPRSGDQIWVKICGITNQPDAQLAIDAGADALGFNLVRQSKRYIDIETAAEWISKLPREICKIAVVANASWEDALRISQLPFIDALQLHGNESAELCRRLAEAGVSFAKALPVADSTSLAGTQGFFTDTVILDSTSGSEFGGTGKPFPWRFARQFIQEHPTLSVILAGGLSPQNVAEAIREAGPHGVDVTTGVEASPGQKDHGLVRAFLQAVRRPLA